MNYNKFISYNIEHNEISRNNEKSLKKPDFYPLKSYEIKSSQILNSLRPTNKINNSNEIQKIYL